MLVGHRTRSHALPNAEGLESLHSPFLPTPLTGAELALGKIRHIFHAATEPMGLATMAAGSLAFGLGRLATVGGLARWAPRLWQARPLIGHLAGTLGGLVSEAATYSTAPRVVNSVKGRGADWEARSFAHDVFRNLLLFGMLRSSGWAGSLFLQNPAARVFGTGAGAVVSSASMGLGIYGNYWVEEKLDWRHSQGSEKRFWDSAETVAQFQVAGLGVSQLLGTGYQKIQQHLEGKVREIQNSWRNSLPGMSSFFPWAWEGAGWIQPKRTVPIDAKSKAGLWAMVREDGEGSGEVNRLGGTPAPESGVKGAEEVRRPLSSEPPPPETIQYQLMPGMKLGNGRYKVLEIIAKGGMGEVWRLFDHTLDRTVATKLPHPEFRSTLLPRFEAEYRLQAHLPREWRVEIYEILEVTKGLKIPIMEDVPGTDLNMLVHLLRDGFEMGNEHHPIEKRIGIFADICEAVHATHSTGILHRDLKPDNIRLTSGDYIRILDYGVATQIKGVRNLPRSSTIPPSAVQAMEAHKTVDGHIVGTPGYIAPEVMANNIPKEGYDPRQSDVFSLGVILFEIVTGRQPWGEYRKGVLELGELPLVPIRDSKGYTKVIPHRVVDAYRGIRPPAFKDFDPIFDTPLYRRLEKVALQAMSPDLKERFPTAQALRQAVLMAEPSVIYDRLEEIKAENLRIEEELQAAEPNFRRSRRKSPQESLHLTQLEQRARFLKETWAEEGEGLVTHLLALTHREDFPAAQHMIAKLSADQVSDWGSRLHPVRRAILTERIRENDVPHLDYSTPVMARALTEGVPVQIQIHPIHESEQKIEGVRWTIIRLDWEKDSHGNETGNFIKGRSVAVDPNGALPALEHGYYVFEIQAPGYAPMNVPISLSYEKIKRALETGKSIQFNLEMVPAAWVPSDMVVIHRTTGYIGHNFYLDGDTASANSFPERLIEIPTMAVSKDPVGVRQYKLFIEDLLADNAIRNRDHSSLFRARLDQIETLLPRTTVPIEVRGTGAQLKGLVRRALGGVETTFYWKLVREAPWLGLGPTRRAHLVDPSTHDDPFGEPIYLEHPISAISFGNAMSYIEWRIGKEKLPYQMLSTEYKEVITRHSFKTRYSWGNGPMTDAYVVSRGAFEDLSRATPQIIGTHPMGQENYRDWSWYGLRDLIGNVREFTSTQGEPDHVCLSGGCVRQYPGANFNPASRYQAHIKSVVDSDGTFRLMLPFPEKK